MILSEANLRASVIRLPNETPEHHRDRVNRFIEIRMKKVSSWRRNNPLTANARLKQDIG